MANKTMETPMTITASKLRANIYRVLDQAVETGVPVEVVRKGIVLRIVPETRPSKLSRLKKRTAFVGDPDDIFKIDWRRAWTALK
jgi:prevent-host-death family protein